MAVAVALWHRRLEHYPDTRPRMMQLGIVVTATNVLYYELYVASAVAPSIIAYYGMSFPYYVYITVAANAVGAFASLLAGMGDRWGRANLVAYGLGITGLLTAFALPNAPTAFTFALLTAIVGFVEGIVLVATPALVRDYSPQLGRASAMGFWTLGPVVGSLVVAAVSSSTVTALPDWQAQYVICGIVGLVVFVIALVGMRELSPNLRDQLMVSLRDRALLEARAAGVDTAPERPWRQVMHLDVIGSAFAVAVFLIIYYTAVGFFTIYFTTIFGYGLAEANGIGNWFWAFDAIALILVGIVSDRLGVRKPFMLVGAVASVVMTIVFLTRGPDTSYTALVVITSLTAVSLGIAYAPWMASFTETVERRNPALIANGLAVWGWIVRAVVAISIFMLPQVVSSMTPLVQYGTEVKELSTQYAPQLQTIAAIDQATLAALPGSAPSAVREIAQKLQVDAATATARLQAVASVPREDLAFLQAHGTEVASAAEESAGQWRTWWWVCVGGELLFIPFVFVMSGRWSPRRARQDVLDHERLVSAELERLERTPTG